MQKTELLDFYEFLIGESGYPGFSATYWIPASAGMTENRVWALCGRRCSP
jgi:hypothetical protein